MDMHIIEGEPTLTATGRARIEGADAERAAILRFLRAEQAKHAKAAADCPYANEAEARLQAKAAVLTTMIAYIERGDHHAGEVQP